MTLNPFALRRELADAQARIVSLEFAIREANDWLEVGEGVSVLYYWPKDTAPSFRALMKSVIGNTRRSSDDE